MRVKSPLLAALVLALIPLAALGPAPAQTPAQEAARDQLILNNAVALVADARNPVMGNPKGDIWIVAFTDYNCPYCKAVEPRLMALLKADPGVKLIVKEYPILGPGSLTAARAALAAHKQGKYAALHNALMARSGVVDDAVVFAAAASARLDMARLKRDMDSADVSNQIIANFNLARALRAFQTPTYIVEGHFTGSESARIDFPALVAAARKDNARYRR